MRIVGIDLSLNSAGIYVLHEGASDFCAAITAGNDTKQPIAQRYDAVVKAIVQIVQPADVVFIEDYSFGSSSASVTLLAELGGIVRYVLWKKTGLWPFPVGVSIVKKFATGKGHRPVFFQRTYQEERRTTSNSLCIKSGEWSLSPAMKEMLSS